MKTLPWVVVAIGLAIGAWLTFDGSRALLVGDYVTPRSGDYAGQLGPWSSVVSAIGIDPRSTLMKTVHVVLGVAWLAATAGWLAGASLSRRALIACAILSLWYLPFGTLFGIGEILLLRRLGTFSRQN